MIPRCEECGKVVNPNSDNVKEIGVFGDDMEIDSVYYYHTKCLLKDELEDAGSDTTKKP